MTLPRRQQISLEHTPYYHCSTRCVRQAFLCGKDRFTGRNFDHRKRWLEQRIVIVSSAFAIDLLAYAIMSNHYHVVIGVDQERAHQWSDEEVAKRWGRIFKLPDLIDADRVQCWRQRLASISWFMRCLNETVARLANREDRCKGRFWEGRFKCQALLDQAALLKCMVYVDLNPIRAAVATTPECSDHTSIKARIEGRDTHLVPFRDRSSGSTRPIPMCQNHYLSLVDWTGRQTRADKRGHIPHSLQPIMQRLELSPAEWLREIKHYGRWYYRAVGSITVMQQFCAHLGQRWLKGMVSKKTTTAKAMSTIVH